MLKATNKRLLLALLCASSFSLAAMEPQAPTLSKEQATKLLFKLLEYGPLEDVKHAIDAGADVNMKDKWDRVPLHYAAASGYSEIIRELMSNGADVNAVTERKFTPLHFAAYNGKLEATRELIAQGADVNVVNDVGSTPLYGAARDGHLEEVRELLIYGARANLNEDLNDLLERLRELLTNLEYALIFCTLNELISLINRREPLTPEELQSALALATGQGRLEIVTFLISNYNLPQPALVDALRIVRVIFTRFELLQQAAPDDGARARLAQDRQPYQAVYDLVAEHLRERLRQSLSPLRERDRLTQRLLTYFGYLPSEIFTLLLWFVINTQIQK
jgi:ankyrin repeat protein